MSINRMLPHRIDDEVVEGLFQMFPGLEKINFRSCYKITAECKYPYFILYPFTEFDIALSLLPTLPTLKSLNLSETGLKGTAFETIPNCTNLQELILIRCPTTPALIKYVRMNIINKEGYYN